MYMQGQDGKIQLVRHRLRQIAGGIRYDLKAFVHKNLRFEFVFAQILYRIRLQNAI